MLQRIRHPIPLFLLKLSGICAAWFMLYDLWLMPDGRLDAAAAESVAAMSASLLETAGFAVSSDGRDVVLSGSRGVHIADGCNGLSVIGLFIGFVLTYRGSWVHRAWFIPMGMLLVYLTNVGRVTILAVAQVYWPAGFDLMHGFGMTTIFYVVVFGLWVAWMKLSSGATSM